MPAAGDVGDAIDPEVAGDGGDAVVADNLASSDADSHVLASARISSSWAGRALIKLLNVAAVPEPVMLERAHQGERVVGESHTPAGEFACDLWQLERDPALQLGHVERLHQKLMQLLFSTHGSPSVSRRDLDTSDQHEAIGGVARPNFALRRVRHPNRTMVTNPFAIFRK